MGHSAGNDIDPTFYRSPAAAISAPPEQLAYVVAFDRAAQQPNCGGWVSSRRRGRVFGRGTSPRLGRSYRCYKQ